MLILSKLGHDLLFALRSARVRPAFPAIVIATLALGMGVVVTVFSVLDSVLLRPLPFFQPERLVWAGEQLPNAPGPAGPTVGTFGEWISRVRSLSTVAGYLRQPYTIRGSAGPERISVALVTADFFGALRTRPSLGRGLLAADDEVGAAPVAVLSDELWRESFSADPKIVGRTILLEGLRTEVVGIMPSVFTFPGTDVRAWVPLAQRGGDVLLFPQARLAGAVGRMRSHVTVEVARRELDDLRRPGTQLGAAAPGTHDAGVTLVVPLRNYVASNVQPALLLLFGASALVLLVTCANVAHLLLTRATARQRELAVRATIGATPGRIFQQLLVESSVFAICAAALGVMFARAAVPVIRGLSSGLFPRASEMAVHPGTLVLAVGLAVLTTILVGVMPALHAAWSSPAAVLKTSGVTQSASLRSVRVREVLVVTEVAATLLLLTVAGLLGKSMAVLVGGAVGFSDDHVLTALVMRPLADYPTNKQWVSAFGYDLVARLRTVPGVRASAISLSTPGSQLVPGYVRTAGEGDTGPDSITVNFEVVTPAYFEVLGIPLLRGRAFDEHDGPDGTPTLILSRSVASRLFPNRNAVGEFVRAPGEDTGGGNMPVTSYLIVGVVGDVRPPGPAEAVIPQVYIPFAREPVPHMTVLVRAAEDPMQVAPAILRAIHSLDSTQAVAHVESLDRVLAQSAARPRFYFTVISVFAISALILAAVGLYGVIAFTVRQRTHEIGVRIALGATAADVLRVVMQRGAKLALLGIFVGILCAVALSRLLTDLFTGVSPTDPLVLGGITLILLLVSCAASFLPARAALRVDPTVALRAD